MKLCTGSIFDSNGWYLVILSQYEVAPVIGGTGTVNGSTLVNS